MNVHKLKEAEHLFFLDYPEGFNSPELLKSLKKHRMDKITDFAHQSFSPETFKNLKDPDAVECIIENMIKLVSKSSMVSLFEKPKFRDSVRNMTADEKIQLVMSLDDLLHGNEEIGFNNFLNILTEYKLAKWTLITVFRCYYYPDTDLLFKPTTVKTIIKLFEIENLIYKPKPSYEFFVRYRDVITEMKNLVDNTLTPSYAAFSGFLMMSFDYYTDIEPPDIF